VSGDWYDQDVANHILNKRTHTDVGKNATGGWLFKEEPDHYSYADLERDGGTRWDGITNALARQNLRKVKPGDRVLYYHTGKEKAVVGEMRVVAGPDADPESDDAKAVVVHVEPVRRWEPPVTLERIKADAALATWDLVRLPRLSVVPVSPQQWRRLETLRSDGRAAKAPL
jgi:predicted RNA-binding protein with PUA-like domain